MSAFVCRILFKKCELPLAKRLGGFVYEYNYLASIPKYPWLLIVPIFCKLPAKS